MGRLTVLTTLVLAFSDCTCRARTLLEARKGFTSKLQPLQDDSPLDVPPASSFSVVSYEGPTGQLHAYLSQPPASPELVPGVVYLTGGFPVASPGAFAWERASPRNDQSGRQFREAGLVLMLPVLRGVAGNPGQQEGFLGEVDDVLAAIDFLSKQRGVDPQRLYLVGHSTGGTLALLVAESTSRLRGVFSYGPVGNLCDYGPGAKLPFDVSDQQECEVRSPLKFVGAITAPTLIMEGDVGNTEALTRFAQASSQNHHVRVVRIKGSNHFSHLASLNALLAAAIKRTPVEVDPRPSTKELIDAAAVGRKAPLVVDSTSWRFVLPPDSEPVRSAEFAESFMLPVGADEVFLIGTQPLDVNIDQRCPLLRWDQESRPEGFSLSTMPWRGREVCVGRSIVQGEEGDFVQFEVAIPVKPALVLHAQGAVAREAALRQVLQKAVSSLEGESNWP